MLFNNYILEIVLSFINDEKDIIATSLVCQSFYMNERCKILIMKKRFNIILSEWMTLYKSQYDFFITKYFSQVSNYDYDLLIDLNNISLLYTLSKRFI